MIQYITTLINKYIHKPSPKQIHDKFLNTIIGLVDKRTSIANYSWRIYSHGEYRNRIFNHLSDGSYRGLQLLLPPRIRFYSHQSSSNDDFI